MQRVLIVGTGLIGASVGLALRAKGFDGEIIGTGPTEKTLTTAQEMGAIDTWYLREAAEAVAATCDVILLAGPVMSILDWMQRLVPVLSERQLVTDVGSTKVQIAELAETLGYNGPGKVRFLPGHPMAGKESGGAALAEAGLFENAMWLFTPIAGASASELETEWRAWVAKFGARTMDLDPMRHDEICAWVSHLPQMLSTALAALLEETFAGDPVRREEIAAIGGRALRETTRLGASPYSMWRDIALSNTDPIAQTLLALEQRLAHVRENLRTPELKEEFRLANEFFASGATRHVVPFSTASLPQSNTVPSEVMGTETNSRLSIELADVVAARERLGDAVYYSPCPHSLMLSALTGQQVYLKLENLQMTGSFKERGALNRIARLTPEQAARGVIAASAGNHAQGVAYHATKRGIRAVIVMPLTTPLVKVTATRDFGAEVLLHGANYDEAFVEASRLCESEGLTLIHPFDDPDVMAGQGTIGLELLEQLPQLEAVVVPIGGGGLISGIACAIKESRPEIRIVGVQTARLPSMAAAMAAHHPVTIDAATTIADGIAVRRAGELTLPLVERYVDEIVLVDEDEIASAILMLLEREKTLAEGAGAAALAALLQRRTSLQGAHTAVLVCGGNIDVTLLSRIIERGMVQDGRLIRLRIHLLDKPGALHDLTRLIASHRANIVDTLHNRAYYGVNLGDTVIDITMETRGPQQVAELLEALTAEGYKHSRVL